MISSKDTLLTEFSINVAKSDDVLREMERQGLPPRQMYMTPETSKIISNLRTELIYSASDPSKNTISNVKYASGVTSGTTVNIDLSKYDKLFWVCCTNSTLGRYQVSNILDKSHPNSDGKWSSTTLYQENPIRMGITVTNTTLEVLNSYSGSRLIYLAGILKTPAVIYSGFTMDEVVKDVLDKMYPINSIYLTLNDSGSPAKLFGGTWEKLPEGYALWTASSGAGGTIAAGIPNITGYLHGTMQYYGNKYGNSGAFRWENSSDATDYDGDTATTGRYRFDANEGASTKGIYRSDAKTVQPPAYKIYAYKRIQ